MDGLTYLYMRYMVDWLYMDGLTYLYVGYMGYMGDWFYMDGLTYLHMGYRGYWLHVDLLYAIDSGPPDGWSPLFLFLFWGATKCTESLVQ